MNSLVSLTRGKVILSNKREFDAIKNRLREGGLIAEQEEGYCYLLFDYSASMKEHEKIYNAKSGAKRFAREAIEKGYRVGLIKFSSEATHLCEPVKNTSILDRYIESIEPEGGTNMAHAIQIAREKLENKKGTKAIVLITDGEAFYKVGTLSEASRAKEKGIDIIAIGTDHADEKFLRKIASCTDLARKVSIQNFGEGVRKAAKDLPLLLTY